MKKSNFTILVNSCDSYSDAWYPFFALWKKYWPKCNYPIILNTESKSYLDEKLLIKSFQLYSETEKIPYGKRLLEHLKRIESKYVLMMMDDFFLRDYVDEDKINKCIKWLEENEDIAVFSFANVKDKLNCKDPKYPGYEMRPQVGEYKLNFQGAIWNREKLMKYVREHETPWEFETIGSMRTFNSKDWFYVISDEKESPINYGKKPGLTWGIVRGKWVVEDVKELFEENGITIDYSIRGELQKEDLVEFDKNNQQGGLRNLRSLGLLLYSKILVWRSFRIVRKILHLPIEQDYIAYLREKR